MNLPNRVVRLADGEVFQWDTSTGKIEVKAVQRFRKLRICCNSLHVTVTALELPE